MLAGLRAAAVTIWEGEEKRLPSCTKDYQAAINQVEPLPRKGAHRHFYPSPATILEYFKSIVDAWAALGFKVQARPHVTAPEIEAQIKEAVYERPRLSNRPRGLASRIEPVAQSRAKRNALTGQIMSQGGTTVARLADLPTEGFCLLCEITKPTVEMVVAHLRKQKLYRMRPRCKDCHNKRERGHRREYKRNYQRRWRADNKKLEQSYWQNDPERKKKNRTTMAARVDKLHYAILIQSRLRRRLNLKTSTAEAEALLKRFGPCYPSRFGLTPEGLRAVERLRATMRREKKGHKAVELRIVVYEQGLFIEPDQQPLPYQNAAQKLRDHRQREKREKGLEKAA